MTRRGLLSLGLFQTKVTEQQQKIKRLEVEGEGPTRFFMRAGPEPTDTDKFDAVLYVDQALTPKVRTRDGKLFAMPRL